MNEIKNKIEDISKSLGFDLIKFTKYEKLESEIELFKNYIENHFHADMKWMENNIEKREDPKLVFHDVKSVIVMASSYNFGISHLKDKNYGKVARYAWGRDYHKVLDKRTKKFRQALNEIGVNSKFYTDTGPCLDRQWAVKAGLGWQGKNGMVINKNLGSYFFITVGFLDIELSSDTIHRDYCGECTKCIKACPTDAIIQDKVVDSNKCISYWTIENRDDSFPQNISKNQENWLFGCDICQEVCPWNNHRNLISKELDFLPRNNETSLSLDSIGEMNEDEFSIRFMSSPIKRTKLKGLKRNAFEIKEAYNNQ